MDSVVAAALETDLTIDITTTGRRSGRPHRVEIWFLSVDGRIFIMGTPRPRDWLANLRADRSLTFHLKESVTADLSARATEVTDPALRARVIDHPSAAWYVDQAGRDHMIRDAPMVEITFEH